MIMSIAPVKAPEKLQQKRAAPSGLGQSRRFDPCRPLLIYPDRPTSRERSVGPFGAPTEVGGRAGRPHAKPGSWAASNAAERLRCVAGASRRDAMCLLPWKPAFQFPKTHNNAWWNTAMEAAFALGSQNGIAPVRWDNDRTRRPVCRRRNKLRGDGNAPIAALLWLHRAYVRELPGACRRPADQGTAGVLCR